MDNHRRDEPAPIVYQPCLRRGKTGARKDEFCARFPTDVGFAMSRFIFGLLPLNILSPHPMSVQACDAPVPFNGALIVSTEDTFPIEGDKGLGRMHRCLLELDSREYLFGQIKPTREYRSFCSVSIREVLQRVANSFPPL